VNDAFQGQPIITIADINAKLAMALDPKDLAPNGWMIRRYAHAAGFAKDDSLVNFRRSLSSWFQNRSPKPSAITNRSPLQYWDIVTHIEYLVQQIHKHCPPVWFDCDTPLKPCQAIGVHDFAFVPISEACELPESDVMRFLRYGIARHFFAEPSKGAIVHTAASRLTVHNKLIQSWLMNIADEFWPSLSRTVDATLKWPGSEEPNESV
jgi:hypothetical protein